MSYLIHYSIKSLFILFFILFSCDEIGTPGSGGDDSDDNLIITSLDIIYNSEEDIAGFQFTVTGVTLLGASGGIAVENGFTVNFSGDSGIVLGFSLDGSTIPSGEGILIQLEVQTHSSAQACITDIILANTSGQDIDISALRFDNNSSCITIGS